MEMFKKSVSFVVVSTLIGMFVMVGMKIIDHGIPDAEKQKTMMLVCYVDDIDVVQECSAFKK